MKIVVITDRPAVDAWLHRGICLAASRATIRVVQCESRGTQTRRGYLQALFRRVDESRLESAPETVVPRERSGLDWITVPVDVSRLGDAGALIGDADLVLDCTGDPDLLARGLFAFPRCGVWYFSVCGRALRPDMDIGLLALANHSHVGSVELVALDRTGQLRICSRTEVRMHASSPAMTAQQMLRAATPALAMSLDKLQRNGTIEGAFSEYPAEIDTARQGTRVSPLHVMASSVARTIRNQLQPSMVDQWSVGVVEEPSVPPLQSDLSRVNWIEPPRSTLLADPFLIIRNGQRFMFVEEFPFPAGKGRICVMEGSSSGGWSQPRPVLETDHHLSFPFVFDHDGEFYMLPEQASRNQVVLYRAERFPDRWKEERVLVGDFPGIDPVIHHDGERWWLFVTHGGHGNWDNNLHLYSSDSLHAPFVEHPDNPVKMDIRGSRMAGRLLTRDGRLYRPAQNCAERYGGAVAFHVIERLDRTGYREKLVSEVGPAPARFGDAFHTFNVEAGIGVVDGKHKVSMRVACPPPKVLVLGNDMRSFLSVVRSLGRKGVEVHTAWASAKCAALASRYIEHHHALPAYEPGTEQWKSALRKLLEAERYDLVIPCDDPRTIPLQEHRAEFAAFPIYLLDEEIFRTVSDKRASAALAGRLGIPVPASVHVQNRPDMEEALQRFAFPLVLKPISSFTSANVGSVRHEVRKAYDREQAFALLDEMLLSGSVVVQENFVGRGAGVEVLARNGRILTAFQHLRVHEPLHGGGSSYRVSVPLNAELLDASRKLIAALGYTGVCMIEYKIDVATGKWTFIEINGRFWGSLPLAIACGADFPWYLFQMLVHGREEFPQAFRTGVYCRNIVDDVDWLRANSRADRTDATLLTVSPWQLAAETRNVLLLRERSDTFVIDDPLPGVIELRAWLKERSVGATRKAALALMDSRLARRMAQASVLRRMRNARRVVFVCWGNICRSPFAEAYARRIFGSRLQQVSSFGFSGEQGRSTPPEGIAAARQFGIDLTANRSAVIDSGALESADLILVFDERNRSEMVLRFPELAGKTYLLGQLDPTLPLLIEDPWGKSERDFVQTYTAIKVALDAALLFISRAQLQGGSSDFQSSNSQAAPPRPAKRRAERIFEPLRKAQTQSSSPRSQ